MSLLICYIHEFDSLNCKVQEMSVKMVWVKSELKSLRQKDMPDNVQ